MIHHRASAHYGDVAEVDSALSPTRDREPLRVHRWLRNDCSDWPHVVDLFSVSNIDASFGDGRCCLVGMHVGSPADLPVVTRVTSGRIRQHFLDDETDGGPARRTEQHWMDGFQHLAKVRVAGSNPVVRSKRNLKDPRACRSKRMPRGVVVRSLWRL